MTALTLVDFLRARLDEDEAVARAWEGEGPWSLVGLGPGTDYEGRFHPARVLAEIEAKRRIIKEHYPQEVASLDRATWCQMFSSCRRCRVAERQVAAPCPTVRLLALPYADHPDYRQEWKPDA